MKPDLWLKKANEVAEEAVKHGNNPFGAVLIDENGKLLLQQGNIEGEEKICTGHAELKLCEKASKIYLKEFLKKCTLVTTVEPCAMCAGAIYWSGISQVIYGISEKNLLELTGNDPLNPTMSLACREVFSKGQHPIEVIGPVEEVREEILKLHKDFWGGQHERKRDHGR